MKAASLIDYNFGDCEIREVMFNYPDALIIIFDPYYNRDVHVKLFNVEKFLFISDHTQNVIGGLYIFESNDLNEFRVKFPRIEVLEKISGSASGAAIPMLYVFSNAVAGGEIFCQIGRYEYSVIGSSGS